MGDRLSAYRLLLRTIRDAGYVFWSVPELAARVTRGATLERRVCVLRVDVDSDPAGAARMFACERECGVRATYYFRLSTLDPDLVRQIIAYGSEVGYHFEEIATVAKRLGLRSRADVDVRLEAIRTEFRHNIAHFTRRCGYAPRTVAAHGDFANRRIGIANSHLLTRRLIDELGLVSDIHDERVYGALAARFLDQPAPTWWTPDDPVELLAAKRPSPMLVLVHPRQWTCNPLLNLSLDIGRVREEIAYRLRQRVAATRAESAGTSTRV